MRVLSKTVRAIVLMTVLAAVLPVNGANAYCNQDPCAGAGGRIVCSSCDYAIWDGTQTCFYRWIYCVDCDTAEFIYDDTTLLGCIPFVF